MTRPLVGLEERLRDAMTSDELGARVALSRLLARTFGCDAPVRIGRYALARRLGAGGMGEVWAADDPELGRTVAIKILHSEIPRAQLVEARALARLRHPGAVEVFEIGEHEGRAYIVMQYVAGCTLAQWLATDPPWRAIVAMLAQVGRALADSHAAGLVHRDIKPTNIMLDEQGCVKLVDFGIAVVDPSAITAPRGSACDESTSDAIAGTLPYMAPEQLAGRTASAQSDQFALCVIAWRALTRAALFEGDTLDERLASIAAGPLGALPRACPRALERALRRGLDPDPDARWPDMDALVRALLVAERSRLRKVASFTVLAATALVAIGFARPQRSASIVEPHLDAIAQRSSIARLAVDAASLRLDDQDWRGAIEWLTPALRDAEASGDDIAAVRAAGMLMTAYERLGDSARSDHYRRHAEATMRRVGPHERMRRDFAGDLAIVAMHRGEYETAIEQQRVVVEGAVDPQNKIDQELNLAGLLSRAGRHVEAIEQARAAMRRHRELHDADHMSTIAVAVNVGMVEALGGEHAAAERTFLAGYGLARELLGDDHPYTSTLLFDLGTVALELGEPARAIPQLRTALAQRRALFEPGDQLRRQMLETLVDAQLETGALDDAIASQRELVGEIEASPEPSGDILVPALVELAELQRRSGADIDPVLRRMQPWLEGAVLPAELTARIVALR